MSHKKKLLPSARQQAAGPVVPGTPLYRILEMVAREVARDLVKHQDARTPPNRPAPH